jgi:hypothetical protein
VPYQRGGLDDPTLRELGKLRPLLVATPSSLNLGRTDWGDYTFTIHCVGAPVTLTNVQTGWWNDTNGDGYVDDTEIDTSNLSLTSRLTLLGTDCVSSGSPGGTLFPHGATCTIQVKAAAPLSAGGSLPIHSVIEISTAGGMILAIPVLRM